MSAYTISQFAGNYTNPTSAVNAGQATAGAVKTNSVWGDSVGNVFVLDSNAQEVRKVNSATGIISLVGSTVGLEEAKFMWGDSSASNVFVNQVNQNTIVKMNTASGVSSAHHTSASLFYTHGLWGDSLGHLYFVSAPTSSGVVSGLIRKIDALTGIVSTVAGGGAPGTIVTKDDDYSWPDPLPLWSARATSVYLQAPHLLTGDAEGRLYVSDALSVGQIRETDLNTGMMRITIEMVAEPRSMWSTPTGDLFIGASYSNDKSYVFNVPYDAVKAKAYNIAGNGNSTDGGDGGPARNASISAPYGLWGDSVGDLYVAVPQFNAVRKLTLIAPPAPSRSLAISPLVASAAPTDLFSGGIFAMAVVLAALFGVFFARHASGVKSVTNKLSKETPSVVQDSCTQV